MDAATYHAIARQLGACDVERDHELANARWDLLHRPDRVRGDDPYEIAAAALTAWRAEPVRYLEPVEYRRTEHPIWTPGQALAARVR